MYDLRFLQEKQQAEVYKKLCESALRVYAYSQDEDSATSWKNIYSYITEQTGAKARKNKGGLKVIIGDYCETISLNTGNPDLKNSISRTINIIDDGTPEGNRRIKLAHGFVNALHLGSLKNKPHRRTKSNENNINK